MALFDDNDFRLRFIEEFKKIDATFDTFRQEFEAAITDIIREFHPAFEATDPFNDLLAQFATAALNIAHSVLDRDDTYPDFRKTEDLAALQTYYNKAAHATPDTGLAERIHRKTKELVVKSLPQIINLSADGFRLMELNLKIFNLEFIATFNNMQE